jgi:hypothetical protein
MSGEATKVIVGGPSSMSPLRSVEAAGEVARTTHRHACRFCGARANTWDALAWHVRVMHPKDYKTIMAYASAPRAPANASVLHARDDHPVFDERVHSDEEWLAAHGDDWDVLDLVDALGEVA